MLLDCVADDDEVPPQCAPRAGRKVDGLLDDDLRLTCAAERVGSEARMVAKSFHGEPCLAKQAGVERTQKTIG